MRPELELIKKIEAFLNGTLPETDRIDFEKELAGDPQLQESINIQLQLMTGIERALLRQDIVRARFRFKWLRHLYRGGLGAVLVIITCFLLVHFNAHKATYEGKNLPVYNESGQKNWASADSNIVARAYFIDVSKDTVIETKGGIVFSIPANCFLTKDGQPVSGLVELSIKEALDPVTIMKAGLSTKSGNDLLETGGMFFIDARKDGEPLTIKPAAGIYAQIPADSVRADMHLFHGVRLANGSIDWTKPKPIDHDLVPVDIKSLNFYPPHYLDSLAKWGYDATNKKFTDSLYYSLGPTLVDANLLLLGTPDSGKVNMVDTTAQFNTCAVNPAKIKAIWNDKFQNTIISTREFEQRLYWIHKEAPYALDIYISNLDKPLYMIDSLVALASPASVQEKFLSFAARRDGKVNVQSHLFEKLKKYYQLKSKVFSLAAEKTEREFRERQAAMDKTASEKEDQHRTDSTARSANSHAEEFDINLKEAYRQLGYKPTSIGGLSQVTYNVEITQTGWCNVDRYVDESVTNRTTLNFTDKQTGRKAVIKYTPVSFSVDQSNNYDRIYLYLLPDQLNSFVKLDATAGRYLYKLDELIKYNAFYLAYKKEKAFVFIQKDVLPKNYAPIKLMAASDKEVAKIIAQVAEKHKAADLNNEIDYQKFEIRDLSRRQSRLDAEQLKCFLIALMLKCIAIPPEEGVGVPIRGRDTVRNSLLAPVGAQKPQFSRSF